VSTATELLAGFACQGKYTPSAVRSALGCVSSVGETEFELSFSMCNIRLTFTHFSIRFLVCFHFNFKTFLLRRTDISDIYIFERLIYIMNIYNIYLLTLIVVY
jgi:hypothetical protein